MNRPPIQVFLIGLATALVLPGDSILYAVLPVYYPELGLSPIQVGILLSANRWVRLFSNQLAEACLRRRPELWVVAAMLLGSLVMVIYATVSLFGVLLLARLLWGIAFSFQRQAGIMTVVATSHGARLRQNMGYLRAFTAAGGIVGVALGGLGHDTIGFSATVFGFFALSLAAAPLGYLSQRGSFTPRGSEPAAAAPPAPPAPSQPVAGGVRWFHQHWKFVCYGFAVGMVGPGLISSTLGLLLKERLGDSVLLFGVALGVATISGIALSIRWSVDGFGSPLLGALADRFGRERLVPHGFLVGGAGLALAGLAGSAAAMLAGVVVLFLCGTMLGILLTSWAGQEGSRTVSILVTANDFGSGLGPLIGWSIAQFALDPGWILAAGAGIYGAAMLLSLGQGRPLN